VQFVDYSLICVTPHGDNLCSVTSLSFRQEGNTTTRPVLDVPAVTWCSKKERKCTWQVKSKSHTCHWWWIHGMHQHLLFFPLAHQGVMFGTLYASRRRGQKGDSGWGGVSNENMPMKMSFSQCVHFVNLHLPCFNCTSQHRRLSETSISPPGSSIGSPSRVICVSNMWLCNF